MPGSSSQNSEPDSDKAAISRGTSPRQRSLRRKTVLAFVVVVMFFSGLEGGLVVLGVRQFGDLNDSFLDIVPGPPLFTRDGDRLRTTTTRLTYFNDQSFAAVKPVGTKRVFCLGGSTTFGRPYDDSTSYVGWLRELLNESDQNEKWEVVNCGGISYASYRLARVTDELLQYQPDVFIIYTEHNEFLEDRTYREVKQSGELAQLGIAAIAHSRTATLLQKAFGTNNRRPEQHESTAMADEVDTILDHTTGPVT